MKRGKCKVRYVVLTSVQNSVPDPDTDQAPAFFLMRIWISVAGPDPGSSAFLTPVSGMGKKSGSRSGMNNFDQIF
jgi:hypothetical protein